MFFKLTIIGDDDWNYDEFTEFVVRANSARRARQLVLDELVEHERSKREYDRWADPKRTACKLVPDSGEEEIILAQTIDG